MPTLDGHLLVGAQCAGLAVGVVGTTLYAIGGGSDNGYSVSGTVEALDAVSLKWSNGLPAMPTPRDCE